MDDIKKAMLGDREAQQRLTERGELLPCPFCGGDAMTRNFGGNGTKFVSCDQCYCDGAIGRTKEEAIENWNTRPALLTLEQIKRLEEMAR